MIRDNLPSPSLPSREGVTYLLVAYRVPISILLAIVGTWAYTAGYLVFPQLSNTHKVGLAGGLGAAIIGYRFVAPKLIAMLYVEDVVWIEELNPIDTETSYRKWKVPRQRLKDITFVKTPDKAMSLRGDVFLVESYDDDTLEATGVDRGSLGGRELILYEERVHEIREELEAEANKGTVLQVRARSIIRQAVRDIVMEIFAVIETESVFGGENITSIIDGAMDSLDLDEYEEDVDGAGEHADDLPSDLAEVDGTPDHEPAEEARELGDRAGDGA